MNDVSIQEFERYNSPIISVVEFRNDFSRYTLKVVHCRDTDPRKYVVLTNYRKSGTVLSPVNELVLSTIRDNIGETPFPVLSREQVKKELSDIVGRSRFIDLNNPKAYTGLLFGDEIRAIFVPPTIGLELMKSNYEKHHQ